MKTKFILLGLFVSSLAFSKTFEVDYAELRGIDVELVKTLCETELSIVPGSDFGVDVVKQQLSETLNIKKTRETNHVLHGSAYSRLYTGPVRTQIYRVTRNLNDQYNPPVEYRVSVLSYGDPQNPKALAVYTELLNYKNDEELNRESVCWQLKFKPSVQ